MKVETKRVISLTTKEASTIRTLTSIFENDDALDVNDIWDILINFKYNDNKAIKQYNYDFIITD